MTLQTHKKSKLRRILFWSISLAIIGGGVWYLLVNGISIDHIRIASFDARLIRLQYDEGINLSIESIDIVERATPGAGIHPNQLIAHYSRWTPFFSEITINQVRHQDKVYTVQLVNEQIWVTSDAVILRGTLNPLPGEVQFNLDQLELKEQQVTLTGIFTYIPEVKQFNFQGDFSGASFAGELFASYAENRINCIAEGQLSNLAEVLGKFPLDRELVSWIDDNISADHYLLEQLKFSLAFNEGKLDILPDSITGKAVAKDVKIIFEPSLAPVTAKSIQITYAGDQLSFQLDEPRYKTKNLNGSTVKIAPLLGQNSHLLIDIKTESRLDNDIHEILKAYEINLPLTQQTGTTKASLNLDFDLPEFNLQTRGEFLTRGSEWSSGSINFEINSTLVDLNNNLITISHGDLLFQQEVHASVQGTIKTDVKLASLLMESKDLDIHDGKLDINFSDPENQLFYGSVITDALPLTLNETPVSQYTFRGNRSGETISVSINDDKMSFTFDSALRVWLNDYNLILDLPKLTESEGTAHPFPISVSGSASMIITEQISIPTRKYYAEINGTNVLFAAHLDQGEVLYESKDEGMSLTITDTDAKLAQDFFLFADLEKGTFNLSLKGTDTRNCEGYIEFKNVVINDMMVLNNVLSFINTIPALATFSSPGFDANGYLIEEGVVHFTISGNLLTINKLRTNGKTINTEADGWIDFENDILKMNLELISLKDYSKIISKIPWAGYILLGEEGSISTSLLLTGTLEDTEITTNLPGEIVLLPVNMVKRTVEWPFRLFKKVHELVTEENPAQEQFIPHIADP